MLNIGSIAGLRPLSKLPSALRLSGFVNISEVRERTAGIHALWWLLIFLSFYAQCVVLESGNQLGSEFKSALSSNNVTVTDADLSNIAIARVTYQYIHNSPIVVSHLSLSPSRWRERSHLMRLVQAPSSHSHPRYRVRDITPYSMAVLLLFWHNTQSYIILEISLAWYWLFELLWVEWEWACHLEDNLASSYILEWYCVLCCQSLLLYVCTHFHVCIISHFPSLPLYPLSSQAPATC